MPRLRFGLRTRLVAASVLAGALSAGCTERGKAERGDEVERGDEAAPQRLPPLPVPEHSQLPSVRLRVAPENLETMTKALESGDPSLASEPGGDRPYVDAVYTSESGVEQAVHIRYRGLSPWHHDPEKPSLRIVIPKRQVVSGARRIDLQRPEDVLALRNVLPIAMGTELGLLTLPHELVRVFINDEYAGVYVRSPRPDATAVANTGRMAGTLFKGDNDRASLWSGAASWEARGETPEALAFFEGLLRALRPAPSAESLENFFSFVDRESALRWSVLAILTGSLHTDQWHNHLIHVSLEHGRAELMPWDMNGFGAHALPEVPPDVVLNPFQTMLLGDPRWVHDRNVALYQALEGALSPERQKRLAAQLIERMQPDLEADPELGSVEFNERLLDNVRAVESAASTASNPTAAGGTLPKPSAAWWIASDRSELLPARQRLEQWIDRRALTLRAYLRDVQFQARPLGTGTRVTVFGRIAVRVRNDQGVERVLYPGLSVDTVPFANTLPNGTFIVPVLLPTPFEYQLEEVPERLQFFNAVTGASAASSDDVPRDERRSLSVHVQSFPPPPSGDVVLGPGTLELHEDLRVGPQQRLLVRAGTTLRLADGVDILARGQTLVEGTREAPVRIEPSGSAWGTFGVSGPATRGSRFEFMSVQGGSAGSDGRVAFKGMFNLYECPAASIKNSSFGRNAAGDDAVNLYDSHVDLADSQWNDALSDALDIDLGRSIIERCTFAGAGNDGLDLMQSTVVVRKAELRNNGDKGISVGESTQLVVSDSQIRGNGIGVEIKDESRVWLEGTELSANGRGLHTYRKKWSFRDAGSALLSDSVVRGSKTPVQLEGGARLLAFQSKLPLARPSELDAVPADWRQWRERVTKRATLLSLSSPIVAGVAKPETE